MTRLERREQTLRGIGRSNPTTSHPKRPGTSVDPVRGPTAKRRHDQLIVPETEDLPYAAPELHHSISHSRNFPINITAFLAANPGDPATKVCTFSEHPDNRVDQDDLPIRISIQSSRNICDLELHIQHGPEMATSLRPRKEAS